MTDPAASKDTAEARPVTQVVTGQPTSDGAGVRLNRLLGTPALPGLDPFLMLDEFRSDSPDDYIAGFPDHPHRGFETVTYMLAGRMRHGDNQGNEGLLGPGSVQWMTAGRGIVHSEMPEQVDGLMWGFQLWVNLPAAEKMTAPRYQDIDPENIPTAELPGGGTVKVVAGRFGETAGPVQAAATDPTFFDITLPPGTAFTYALPSDYNAFLYVFDGPQIHAGGAETTPVQQGELAVLGPGPVVRIVGDAAGATRFILLAGRPLREPVARYGPFVMNTPDEIRQAVDDFRAGRFGG